MSYVKKLFFPETLERTHTSRSSVPLCAVCAQGMASH